MQTKTLINGSCHVFFVCWSFCCYGPNADNVFAMNDLQVVQKFGHEVVFVLHRDSINGVMAENEILIRLKSSRGILLIRTSISDPHDLPSQSLLNSNQ